VIDPNAWHHGKTQGLGRLDPDFPIEDKIVPADKNRRAEPQRADRAHDLHMRRPAFACLALWQIEIVWSNAHEVELRQRVVPPFARRRSGLGKLQEIFAPAAAFPLQLMLKSLPLAKGIMPGPNHQIYLLIDFLGAKDFAANLLRRGGAVRGIDEKPTQLFSYVDLERRIPLDHPLRLIRALVDKVLTGQSRTFTKLYARDGRPGIPPERLLRALLLQAFYSVRSERLLMEQLDYNLLFRWFVGLSADDSVWDASSALQGARRSSDSSARGTPFIRGARQLPSLDNIRGVDLSCFTFNKVTTPLAENWYLRLFDGTALCSGLANVATSPPRIAALVRMEASVGDGLGAISVALDIAKSDTGALSGKSFVVKENIDVAGYLSRNGNPSWAASTRYV
jgi:Transposase domain (DUF772)